MTFLKKASFIFLFFSFFQGYSQQANPELLLMNRAVQLEATEAINNMYNFQFEAADKEFRLMTMKYPKHPIGHFLLGLNEWWKIVPNTQLKAYDEACLKHMDDAINIAENMLDANSQNKEAAFFLAASYAFKGRLHAERENWTKAAFVGKNALKYLEKSKGDDDLNPELLFGDGLYNYYSKWIPENYPSLKPILFFFKKGNKAEGLRQLEKVANNAFYTRIEARYFLLSIHTSEGNHQKAYDLAKYMHNHFPQNPYFHRHYAKAAFIIGNFKEAEREAYEILTNMEAKKFGYEGVSGRYAAYIIAYINDHQSNNTAKAKEFYQKTINYALETGNKDSAYFWSSNLALGRLAQEEKDYATAKEYFKIVLDNADKKSTAYKDAKDAASNIKKLIRADRKRSRIE